MRVHCSNVDTSQLSVRLSDLLKPRLSNVDVIRSDAAQCRLSVRIPSQNQVLVVFYHEAKDLGLTITMLQRAGFKVTNDSANTCGIAQQQPPLSVTSSLGNSSGARPRLSSVTNLSDLMQTSQNSQHDGPPSWTAETQRVSTGSPYYGQAETSWSQPAFSDRTNWSATASAPYLQTVPDVCPMISPCLPPSPYDYFGNRVPHVFRQQHRPRVGSPLRHAVQLWEYAHDLSTPPSQTSHSSPGWASQTRAASQVTPATSANDSSAGMEEPYPLPPPSSQYDVQASMGVCQPATPLDGQIRELSTCSQGSFRDFMPAPRDLPFDKQKNEKLNSEQLFESRVQKRKSESARDSKDHELKRTKTSGSAVVPAHIRDSSKSRFVPPPNSSPVAEPAQKRRNLHARSPRKHALATKNELSPSTEPRPKKGINKPAPTHVKKHHSNKAARTTGSAAHETGNKSASIQRLKGSQGTKENSKLGKKQTKQRSRRPTRYPENSEANTKSSNAKDNSFTCSSTSSRNNTGQTLGERSTPITASSKHFPANATHAENESIVLRSGRRLRNSTSILSSSMESSGHTSTDSLGIFRYNFDIRKPEKTGKGRNEAQDLSAAEKRPKQRGIDLSKDPSKVLKTEAEVPTTVRQPPDIRSRIRDTVAPARATAPMEIKVSHSNFKSSLAPGSAKRAQQSSTARSKVCLPQETVKCDPYEIQATRELSRSLVSRACGSHHMSEQLIDEATQILSHQDVDQSSVPAPTGVVPVICDTHLIRQMNATTEPILKQYTEDLARGCESQMCAEFYVSWIRKARQKFWCDALDLPWTNLP